MKHCIAFIFIERFGRIYIGISPNLVSWKQFGYLTYQCLIMQIISMVLHLVASFYKPARVYRDIFFTTIAAPAAICVVVTFWVVWHLLGSKLIIPDHHRPFFPNDINHIVHTMPLFVNLILQLMIRHRYPKRGHWVSFFYLTFYYCLMYIFKWHVGRFPYPFVETMHIPTRIVYYFVNAGIVFLIYHVNRYITNLIHGRESISSNDNDQDGDNPSGREHLERRL